jgi:hypothetical protein
MLKQEAVDHPKPPYIPFKTFLGFLEKLKKHAVPTVIDNSLTQNLSGGMRGALMSALRFLGLIDKNAVVDTSLKTLVAVYGTEQWRKALASIVTKAYAPIIDSLDISSTTAKQLEEKFKNNGKLAGQMADKAIRFYIVALGESGVPSSPYLKVRRARSNGSHKLSKKKGPSKKAIGREENGGVSRMQEGESIRHEGLSKAPFALNPLIQGLINQLPESGAQWPLPARVKWLQAASSNFSLLYTTDNEIEEKVILIKVVGE